MVGDFNGDGVVDAADYTVWRDTSGQTVAAFAGGDANGDTQVDDGGLLALESEFWRRRAGHDDRRDWPAATEFPSRRPRHSC